jgi:STE24 endopeptidase
MSELLWLFIGLSLGKFLFEFWLRSANRRFYLDKKRQQEACVRLGLGQEEFAKTLAYTEDKYHFGSIVLPLRLVTFLAFLVLGGFGYCEQVALQIREYLGGGAISTGLAFFAVLGLLSMLVSLPFDIYSQFVIEEKHGFNRQTPKGFVADLLRSLLIAVVLGGPLVAALLWIMDQSGTYWWLWAWGFLTVFSLFVSWLFPAVLAPMFNKFTPLAPGPLHDQIFALARKVRFKASKVFIMDASRRSSHGNAYFTGLFNEKRIVLFDTLVDKMSDQEIVAVLAHELGHFKLRHVFWGMVRGIITTGLLFYALSYCLPMGSFYTAFHFNGAANYSALVVFSLWYGLLGFLLTPLQSWISRKNEFAADHFAVENIGGSTNLCEALVKLSESNQSMPISHPLYSMLYHSHPPLLQRIAAMKAS